MQEITTWLQQALGLSPVLQERLLSSVLIVLVLWAARRIVLAVVWRRVDDVRSRYRWQKTATYVVVPVGLFLVGRIWFEGFASIATFLGLAAAGLAIALRDILVNLAGWVFILWRRPFEVGDRIEVGEHRGDVIDIRILQFSLLEIGNWVDADQSTGRVLHVPNGRTLTEVTANYTGGFTYIWNELAVLVTFESNWRKAKTILEEIIEEQATKLTEHAREQIKQVSRQFMIFYSTLTPIVYTSVTDSGVRLTIRYLCDPRQRRGTTQAIWEAILARFGAQPDIAFAYRTIRYYDNRLEGKSELRAE